MSCWETERTISHAEMVPHADRDLFLIVAILRTVV